MQGHEFCVLGEKDFSIKCFFNSGSHKGKTRVYFFHDILGSSDRWLAALKEGQISMLNIMKPSANLRRAVSISMTLQGTLLKKPHTYKFLGWNKRFFVLHRTNLLWFKSRKDKVPRGQLSLTAETVIQELPEEKRKFAFQVWAPGYPKVNILTHFFKFLGLVSSPFSPLFNALFCFVFSLLSISFLFCSVPFRYYLFPW